MKARDNKNHPRLKTSTLIFRSLYVLLANAVPVYGVLRFGWDSFSLIFLFIMEGIIVLFTDIIKLRFPRKTGKKQNIIFMEFIFICFYGFFAILVFGPYDSLENLITDRMALIKDLILLDLDKPLLIIFLIRIFRLVQDLFNAGVFRGTAGYPLRPEGGYWMLLLFFMVMSAPIIARSGPNPLGGLIVMVVLKITGELLFLGFSVVRKVE